MDGGQIRATADFRFVNSFDRLQILERHSVGEDLAGRHMDHSRARNSSLV